MLNWETVQNLQETVTEPVISGQYGRAHDVVYIRPWQQIPTYWSTPELKLNYNFHWKPNSLCAQKNLLQWIKTQHDETENCPLNNIPLLYKIMEYVKLL